MGKVHSEQKKQNDNKKKTHTQHKHEAGGLMGWGGRGGMREGVWQIEGLNQSDRIKPSWKSYAGRQESLQSVLRNMTTSSK